jgi:hypothetical protein
MAVRCTRCGEELLGAVNRCWKCGQSFPIHAERDGQPPVRVAAGKPGEPLAGGLMPLDAVVLDAEPPGEPLAKGLSAAGPSAAATASFPPGQEPAISPATRKASASPYSATPGTVAGSRLGEPSGGLTAADLQRQKAMAMGGTVGGLVLGAFGLLIAPFRFEGAIIALVGLLMAIWGLYSPRRRLALLALLLCFLGISLGAYTGARQLYRYIRSVQPVLLEE